MPSFTCTEKPVRYLRHGRWEYEHDAEWELQVQARIRKFKPPCQSPDYALVGRDEDGIGAFLFWEELDGPAVVEICTVAVDMRFRHKGGGVAKEMMQVLFDTLTTRAMDQGVDAVLLNTWIHEKNLLSQRLFYELGVRHNGKCMNGDPELQRWTAQILVGGADVESP